MATSTAVKPGVRTPAPVATPENTQPRLIVAAVAGVVMFGGLFGFLMTTSSGGRLSHVLTIPAFVWAGVTAIAVAVAATQAATVFQRQGNTILLGHIALGTAGLALVLLLIMAAVHAPMASGFTRFTAWLCLVAGLAAVPAGIVARQHVKRETRRWSECTSAVIVGALSVATLCLVIAVLFWFQRVFQGH